MSDVIPDKGADFLRSSQGESLPIAKAANKFAVIDRKPPESRLGYPDLGQSQEGINLGKQVVAGHVGQHDGLLPTCQWAIAQVTPAPNVGTVPPMQITWRQRLTDAIDAKKTNMKRLSLAAGLGETFVRDALLRDRIPSVDNAMKLCRELGVTYEAIFGDARSITTSKTKQNIVEVDGTEFAKLPVYDIRFAAGSGSSNEDETPIDSYLISLNLLRGATDAPLNQIAIFQADGDSMETTINSRDWVFVDRRKIRLTNPGIYALVFEGDGFLKRASQHLETGAVTLISDNAKYPPQTIKKPERLTVVGRVFLSIRRH